MIDLILHGGLGNQMFEYATALAIAEEYGHSIRIDTSFFDAFGGRGWCRPYGLDVFQQDKVACYTQRYAKIVRLLSKVNILCRKYGMQHLGRYYFELNRLSDIAGEKPVVMFGYFTNVHVFQKHEAAIRNAFAFKDEPNEANHVQIRQMQACNSVAVHIRRGDYLNPANSAFAQNSVEWYRCAMKKMAATVQNPRWFFFSDDMEWVRTQFAMSENATFVDINHGRESYNDMRLMMNCKHHIIANSTFSWWAAWLNANPEKIVIAPYRYYTNAQENKKKYLDTMIPKDWIVMQ